MDICILLISEQICLAKKKKRGILKLQFCQLTEGPESEFTSFSMGTNAVLGKSCCVAICAITVY